MKPEAVVIFTLWYYPSHFGLHVDDIADAFATSGIDVRIVTVAEEVYRHHYFDPFRHMFVSDFLERYPVYRLKTLDIADRGLFPPIVVPSLPVDLEAWVLSSARRKPAAIFHFFEHFAWRFNQEAYPEFQATTLYYAGNFVNRILQAYGLDAASPALVQMVIDACLGHLYLPSGHLRGITCILSETRSLAKMIESSSIRTHAYFIDRPFQDKAARDAKPLDLRRSLNTGGDAHLLLYAGRPTKNALILPRVLGEVRKRLNRPVYLILVGTQNYSPNDWPDYAEQKDHIFSYDFVDRPQLFSMMASCDLLVYPSSLSERTWY